MPEPIRISPHIEGSIDSGMFHSLTDWKVSEERLDALVRDGTITGFRIGNALILDIGSVRRWLWTVDQNTFESIKKDLF
jgi:hypothetical protein